MSATAGETAAASVYVAVGIEDAFEVFTAEIDLWWRHGRNEKTLVQVTFTPTGDGTMVRVEHTGWGAIREGHPARHGLAGAAFSRMIGMWWGELLTSLREHVAGR